MTRPSETRAQTMGVSSSLPSEGYSFVFIKCRVCEMYTVYIEKCEGIGSGERVSGHLYMILKPNV